MSLGLGGDTLGEGASEWVRKRVSGRECAREGLSASRRGSNCDGDGRSFSAVACNAVDDEGVRVIAAKIGGKESILTSFFIRAAAGFANTECGIVFSASLDDEAALINPFRKSEPTTGSRVRFGN